MLSGTGGSIHRVGNYRIHQFPSLPVQDGLILHVDAADPRCFDGSNFAVSDLSAYKQEAVAMSSTGYGSYSMDNTFNSAQQGNFKFRRSNGACGIKFNLKGLEAHNTQPFTMECWAKYTTSRPYNTAFYIGGIMRELGFSNNSNFMFGGNGGSGNHLIFTGTSTAAINTWHHLVMVMPGDLDQGGDTGYTAVRFYANGSLLQTNDIGRYSNVSTHNSNHAVIGNFGTSGTNEMLDGHVAVARIYNRALSADEVAQNYNAEKVRFAANPQTFTPVSVGGQAKVELLAVAGGGGGGSKSFGGSGGTASGAGGGAGGLVYHKALLISGAQTITIGAGGTGGGPSANGGNGSTTTGLDGQDTTVGSLVTATGGGGGGGNSSAGRTGGSGGGAGNTDSDGPAGTSGQGYRGGRAASHDGSGRMYPRGGGGGAGGHGGDGAYSPTGGAWFHNALSYGDGGPGLEYDITGKKQFYAGGGGAGSYNNNSTVGFAGKGGSGVGGDGATNSQQNHQVGRGIPRTGSGGGGQGGGSVNDNGCAAPGSEGIVVIRYPASDYYIELLVVGGGGAGGKSGSTGSDPAGGGGGAGGLIYKEKFRVAGGKHYKVWVGRGGANRGSTTLPGDSGHNSFFGSLIAYGGGGGGFSNGNGSSGGSGGGGGGNSGDKGFGTPGQGFNGRDATTNHGGGGGGAGGMGPVPGEIGGDNPGYGGPGVTYSISGTATSYSGGGGGGGRLSQSGGVGGYDPNTKTSGTGGGGNGAAGASNATGGTANTGGGGGGASTGNSASGGSGIVIVAYKGPQRALGGTVSTTARPGYTTHTYTTTGPHSFTA